MVRLGGGSLEGGILEGASFKEASLKEASLLDFPDRRKAGRNIEGLSFRAPSNLKEAASKEAALKEAASWEAALKEVASNQAASKEAALPLQIVCSCVKEALFLYRLVEESLASTVCPLISRGGPCPLQILL